MDDEVLEKAIKMMKERQVLQGNIWKENSIKKALKRRNETGLSRLVPIFHSVVLAKFAQCFGRLTTFLNARFLVVFTSFQFAFYTVDLQFFLQLADRVLQVTFDFYFNHEKSHRF